MRLNGLDKRQIEYCLSCRVGRAILNDYGNIYSMKKEDLEKDETSQEVVNELAEILDIQGELIEKYSILKRLAKTRPEDNTKELELQNEFFDLDEDDPCLANLQQIIHALRCFYNEKGSYEQIVDTENYKHKILLCMNDENQRKVSLVYKYAYDGSDGEVALKEFKKKSFKNTSEDFKKSIADKLKHIFNYYCSLNVNSYKINYKGECFGKLFNEIIKENNEADKALGNVPKFFERLSYLSEKSQTTLRRFLNNMPTQFGYNLEMVMGSKGITEQDIKNFSAGKFSASGIQSLMGCSVPSNINETLRILSKILLVSESVLYLGQGRTYGNWKDLLSDESLDEFQKIDKNLFPNKSKSKKFVQENVSSIVDEVINDDEKFMNMIKDNPALFEDEAYNVYENERERFKYIIDKRYAYILLETLERIEKSE